MSDQVDLKKLRQMSRSNPASVRTHEKMEAAMQELESSRDKIARLEAECAALNKLLLEAIPALSFAADLVRRIESKRQSGEKP